MRKFFQFLVILALILSTHTTVTSANEYCCPATRELVRTGPISGNMLTGQGTLVGIDNNKRTCIYYAQSIAVQDASQNAYQCPDSKICSINRADLSSSQCVDGPPKLHPNEGCPSINHINTALGCIDTRPGVVISTTLSLAVGIGAGIALLLIIYGSFKVLASQGQPDQVNHGKEIITASIIGLVFITLSVSILQIIGIDILGLNDLGTLTPLPLGR